MITKVNILLLLVGLWMMTSSCNRFMDKVRKTPELKAAWGNMVYYPDSNVLTYTSGGSLHRDTEVDYPKHFRCKLPKKLVTFGIKDSQSFTFYYGKSQVIALYIDLSNNYVQRDTSYYPMEDELERFRINAVKVDQYDFELMDIKPRRKHLIIKKGAASILLFNVLPRNMKKYQSFMQEFEFLK